MKCGDIMTIEELRTFIKCGNSVTNILINNFGIYNGYNKNNISVLYSFKKSIEKSSDTNFISIESMLLAKYNSNNKMEMLYEIILSENNELNNKLDSFANVEDFIQMLFYDPGKVSSSSTSNKLNPSITNRKSLPNALNNLIHYVKMHSSYGNLKYSTVDRLILWYITNSVIQSKRIGKNHCLSINSVLGMSTYQIHVDTNYYIGVMLNTGYIHQDNIEVHVLKDDLNFKWCG